jgi:hypothetical protein
MQIARRLRLVLDDGRIRCASDGCYATADRRMLRCGPHLVVFYAHAHPGSEYQLWPALERILRSGELDARAAADLVAQARSLAHAETARADWLKRFDNIVRALAAPDPDEDWRNQ